MQSNLSGNSDLTKADHHMRM